MVQAQHYCLFDTAIGVCGLAWSEGGITRLRLPERDRDALERRLRTSTGQPEPSTPPQPIANAIADVQRYMTGAKVDLTETALDMAGVDPFQRKVYEAARSIVWGETATYGEIAARIGAAGEAREVGQALGRNPVPIIVPCHRVLAKGNRLHGFSAYGGTLTKERLLALEGVHTEDGAPLLLGLLSGDARQKS